MRIVQVYWWDSNQTTWTPSVKFQKLFCFRPTSENLSFTMVVYDKIVYFMFLEIIIYTSKLSVVVKRYILSFDFSKI